MAQSRRQQQQLAQLNGVADAFGEAFESEEEVDPAEGEGAEAEVPQIPPPIIQPPANNNQRRRVRARRRTKGRQKKSKKVIYHRVLVYLMRYLDGEEYSFNHSFGTDRLKEITPNDIVRYFKWKVYKNPDADPDMDIPRMRANAIKTWKKSISYFMPNSHMQYNELAKCGNPTKSPVINKLIKAVKRKETARRGAPSKKRRALFQSELEQAMEHFSKLPAKEEGLYCGSYFRFQLHMAARGDDTAKARLEDMKPFYQFLDYGITMRLCWSKNVDEERDAPTQVIVGAMDDRYCVLCSTGLWLEYHFSLNPEDNDFIFSIYGVSPDEFEVDMEGEDNPEKEQAMKEEACVDYMKEKAYEYLSAFFKDSDFVPVDDGLKGIHSIRKLAIDIIRGQGLSKDDADHRARWKSSDRQQDDYTSTTIPYVDCRSAFALCKGGACAYLIKQGSGITDGWILDHVVPNLRPHVPEQVAIVLGRALLWLVCDKHGHDSYIPKQIEDRVIGALRDLGERNTLEAGENVVSKVPLLCDGVDSELIIEPAGGEDGDLRARNAMQRQEIRMLSQQVLHLRREIADMKQENERTRNILKADLRMALKLLRRLLQVSAFRSTTAAEQLELATEGIATNATATTNTVTATAASPPTPAARLSRCPRTLHALWDEWEVGSATQKPVRLWTAEERGKQKHSIYKRKFLWQKVSEMMQAGHTAQTACDMIYNAYGSNLSVTKILMRLKEDSKRGGHPQLRTRCI